MVKFFNMGFSRVTLFAPIHHVKMVVLASWTVVHQVDIAVLVLRSTLAQTVNNGQVIMPHPLKFALIELNDSDFSPFSQKSTCKLSVACCKWRGACGPNHKQEYLEEPVTVTFFSLLFSCTL